LQGERLDIKAHHGSQEEGLQLQITEITGLINPIGPWFSSVDAELTAVMPRKFSHISDEDFSERSLLLIRDGP
jgi:hypothetical protein